MRKLLKICLCVALPTAACCSSAFAVPIVCIEVEEELETLWSQPYDSETSSLITGDIEASWNLTFDADPYVESSVSLTNKTSSTRTYTVTFALDSEEAITPTSLYGGFVRGSLIANAGGGYFSTINPTPLYMGMIDGIEALSFYPSLLLVTGAGTTTNIAEQSAGLPGPTIIGPACNESILIQHKFKLGAGDTIILDGYFEVVPEPATIGLLGFGALSLIRRKK